MGRWNDHPKQIIQLLQNLSYEVEWSDPRNSISYIDQNVWPDVNMPRYQDDNSKSWRSRFWKKKCREFEQASKTSAIRWNGYQPNFRGVPLVQIISPSPEQFIKREGITRKQTIGMKSARWTVKTHAEGVAESMGSVVDLHSHKRRGWKGQLFTGMDLLCI